MNRIHKTAVAVVSTLAFSLGAAAAPAAVAAKPEPCATQQHQVDRATAKLETLTARFAAHPTQKNHKAKKAQVQRVNRATVRLEKCLANQAE